MNMQINIQALAKKIEIFILNNKMTQTSFARRCGLTSAHINDILRGRATGKQISFGAILAYFDHRDIPPADIVTPAKAGVYPSVPLGVPWFSIYFRILLYMGLRPGHPFKLRWMDIDYRAGLIYIERSKTDAAWSIPIHPDLRPWLDKLPRPKRPEQSETLLFDNGSGGQLYSMSWVSRQLVEACTACGIRRRRVYDFRHTFAYLLASSGRSLIEIQKLMGHKVVQTTMQYIAFYPDDLRNAISSLKL
jgi:integrase